MVNWLKKQFATLALALANVEKNALSQDGGRLSDDAQQVQRHKQGMLSDDLMQGRITEEVKMLRHRMYKILDETSKIKATFKRDAQGNLTYELADRTLIPSKLKVDPYDDYKVELVINNADIFGGMDLTSEHPDDTTVEKQVLCFRDGVTPKFEIEKYTSKLFVRFIKDNERLLEFYIPKYVDHYNRRTTFLISELKKLMENVRYSDLLDIKTVGFVTFNALGCQDFREFTYEITKFNKIVEFDGVYILKFNANVLVNGDNIIDKYKHEIQEQRYLDKAPRVTKESVSPA